MSHDVWHGPPMMKRERRGSGDGDCNPRAQLGLGLIGTSLKDATEIGTSDWDSAMHDGKKEGEI